MLSDVYTLGCSPTWRLEWWCLDRDDEEEDEAEVVVVGTEEGWEGAPHMFQ